MIVKEVQYLYLGEPKNFFFGVATSAFQLEGSPYADWQVYDDFFMNRPKAVNHYNLYKQDLILLKKLGINAYRFSIEWSRIQPSEDIFNIAVLNHYQKIDRKSVV